MTLDVSTATTLSDFVGLCARDGEEANITNAAITKFSRLSSFRLAFVELIICFGNFAG